MTRLRRLPPWVVFAAIVFCSAVDAAAQNGCRGDCDGDGQVTINELITAINITLGTMPPAACAALCLEVDVACLIGAVNNALVGCPPATPQTATPATPATPTATPSPSGTTPGATPSPTETPLPTDTSVIVPTAPPTESPTVEPTSTPVPSATPPPSVTHTFTPTMALTATAGTPASPTRSTTPTRTPTGTRTATPTWSPTSTLPPTRTRTPTFTPSATRTPTFTPSRTNTPLSTFTPTASRTPSTTRTATATVTATSTRVPTPTVPAVPGPHITFFGLATAAGQVLTPGDVSLEGIPIYTRPVGAGFLIVIEARAGSSGRSPGVQTSNLADPEARPDVQIQADRNLGNGSTLVCDRGPGAPLGGVPGITPPSFDPDSQFITDALNDFGCRFDARTAADPCTFNANGIPAFATAGTTLQACTSGVVGRETEFPKGNTLLTVQWRETGPNPTFSLPRHLIVRVP